MIWKVTLTSPEKFRLARGAERHDVLGYDRHHPLTPVTRARRDWQGYYWRDEEVAAEVARILNRVGRKKR